MFKQFGKNVSKFKGWMLFWRTIPLLGICHNIYLPIFIKEYDKDIHYSLI